MQARKKRGAKLWLASPEEFAALRHSCFMSRATCAAFLGVSSATMRGWENGRTRASLSAIRLLRLYRLGDLGALHDSWRGWQIADGKLYAPDGRTFRRRAFTTGRSFGITAAAVPGHALRDHRAPEAVLQKENREP